jgi:hypothetical protein
MMSLTMMADVLWSHHIITMVWPHKLCLVVSQALF